MTIQRIYRQQVTYQYVSIYINVGLYRYMKLFIFVVCIVLLGEHTSGTLATILKMLLSKTSQQLGFKQVTACLKSHNFC